MAQKTGKEETEFKVHEKIPLCINNCGFTGNPATNNMCQNCFNTSNSPTTTTTTTNTNTNSTTTTNASSSTTTMTVTTVSTNKMLKVHHRSSASSFRSAITTEVSSEDVVAMAAAADRVRSEGFSFGVGSEVKREVNRCFGCRRKVGLTGFRCRCGELFCAEHRYTDRHVCSYDYKAAGREAIARENPVVKAAKIVRV
ncbi:hypothetical protein SO802_008275 [Lithocarpus litseifolius]|uniref:Uncharacterized protein n=1 Tax=Lithocarpus litseifolius TaxID=425828 RepID=A0AAW2DAW3_9ROSI